PRPVVVHHDVEHADDVRVLHPRADPTLAQETLPRLLERVVARRCGWRGGGEQLLHRDGAVEQLVGRSPHRTHGSCADALVEPVASADADGGVVGCGAHRPQGYPGALRARSWQYRSPFEGARLLRTCHRCRRSSTHSSAAAPDVAAAQRNAGPRWSPPPAGGRSAVRVVPAVPAGAAATTTVT